MSGAHESTHLYAVEVSLTLQGQDGEQAHQLDPENAQHLKAYVERFLQKSYNILMTGLQKDLDPGLNISRLSHDSFLRFFKLASFFTRYVRLQQVRPRPI